MPASTIGGEALSFALNTATVVIGWGVVHWLTANRDREKSRREMVAASVDLLVEATGRIFIDARQYHSEPRDVALETELKVDLQDLSNSTRSLAMLSSDIALLATCRSLVRAFWKAITAEHFEDEHDGRLAQRCLQLELIAAQSLLLKQAFMNLKYQQWKTP